MHQLLPGELLDNFTIEELLHTGAAANLYKAIDQVYLDHDKAIDLYLKIGYGIARFHDNKYSLPEYQA